MALLSKSDILAASDLETETVAVPEWGGSVMVKALSANAREELFARVNKEEMVAHQSAIIAAAFIVDETGKPVFTADDVAALGEKNQDALARVIEAGYALSGMSADAQEGMAKNSEATGDESSSSN